jgi:hypothetical protein
MVNVHNNMTPWQMYLATKGAISWKGFYVTRDMINIYGLTRMMMRRKSL